MIQRFLNEGEWRSLAEIYQGITRNLGTSQEQDDRRWRRNVRNVLQRRKAAGDVLWNRAGGYRLPPARSAHASEDEEPPTDLTP